MSHTPVGALLSLELHPQHPRPVASRVAAATMLLVLCCMVPELRDGFARAHA